MRFGFVTPCLTVRLRLPALPRRFRFSTLMFLMAFAAVLFAWRRDHMEQQVEIAALRGAEMGRQKLNASWGVEQLLGEPDTDAYGDIRTAWAPASQDGQKEWILVDYPTSVTPASIEVYETHNPGALVKVSIFDPVGREVVVWTGKDPTQPPALGGVSKIPVKTIWSTRQVKIYLDSPAVPGWNEIDTICLIDDAGNKHWPLNATASSAYGGRESSRGSYNYAMPGTGTVPGAGPVIRGGGPSVPYTTFDALGQ
jgi:hypothetical protein